MYGYIINIYIYIYIYIYITLTSVAFQGLQSLWLPSYLLLVFEFGAVFVTDSK